jgi:hypothetical protein
MTGHRARRILPAAFLATLLLSCAAARGADAPARAAAPERSGDAAVSPAAASLPAPVLIGPNEAGFGTSVVFRRVPNTADINALAYVENVQHVIVTLPEWPDDFSQIEALSRVLLPEGADLLVVLDHYPPSRGQASIWNLLRQPLRIVLMVDGPPADRGMIQELNGVHGLERVIATMEHPSRSGFERLQRPLSFRVVMP